MLETLYVGFWSQVVNQSFRVALGINKKTTNLVMNQPPPTFLLGKE